MGLYKLDGQHVDILKCLIEDQIEELKEEKKVWGYDNSEYIKECKTILRRLRKPVKIEK